MNQIRPEELQNRRQKGKPVDLVDVRTPGEFAAVHAEGARLVPLHLVSSKTVLADHPAGSGTIYVICRSGRRSSVACEKLRAAGLKDVVNVAGGTLAWEQAGLPVVRGVRGPSLVQVLWNGLLQRLGRKPA